MNDMTDSLYDVEEQSAAQLLADKDYFLGRLTDEQKDCLLSAVMTELYGWPCLQQDGVSNELRLKRMVSGARDAFAEIAAEMLAAL